MQWNKTHAKLNKNIKNIFIEEQIANVHHVLWCMVRMCYGAWLGSYCCCSASCDWSSDP
jgi:hypothetical protein